MKQSLPQKIGDLDSRVIREFKRGMGELFPEAEIILYGSKARGEGDESSDLDLLVVLNGRVDSGIEDAIYDLGYDLELEYGVVLGILVESRQFWDSELGRAMPLRRNIDREGIKI